MMCAIRSIARTNTGDAARRFAPLVTALAVLLGMAIAAVELRGDDDQLERFVAGLRQRRLFVLADQYCRQQLEDPRTSADLRARATVELLRVLAEHAAQSTVADRRTRLSAARQLSAEFARTQAEHPRLLVVRAQEALGLLSVGEVVRREAELIETAATAVSSDRPREPANESSQTPNAATNTEGSSGKEVDARSTYEEARGHLREGMRLVDALERELQQLIPQRFRRPLPPPALSPEELSTLQANLRFQRARAQRQLALCYPPDSTDRDGGLAVALQAVDKALTPLPSDDPLAPRLQLERATLLRLLKQQDEAATALDPAAWRDAPPALRLAARSERLRLAFDAQQWDAALAQAEVEPIESESPSAELDFARLELFLALWNRAAATKGAHTTDVDRWEERAMATLQAIDVRHGGEWRRRGELLLLRRASSGQGPRSLAALRRTAEGFFLQGRLDDAVAAYSQAAAHAKEAGDREQEFELSYKAALVEQQRGRHALAADRLQAIATELPKLPNAAAAHHLASWNLAQALRAMGSTPQDATTVAELVERYRKNLEQQIQQWPDDDATHEARVWLGKLYESRRAWDEAAMAYRAVSASSAHYAAALEGAGRAWLARIQELRGNPIQRRTEAEAAGKFFEQAAFGSTPETLERWTPPQRAAALVAARAWFESGGPHAARVERLLRTALEHSPDAPDDWRTTAQSLQLVALAGQESRRAEATALANQVGAGPAATVAEALERLGRLRGASSGESRAALAKLELMLFAATAKRTAEWSEPVRERLALQRAAALVAGGTRQEALAAYRELAKTRPRDAALQEELAELLLDGREAAEWREALDQWRRLAAKSEPRSARWYRAKLGVATAEHRLGNHVAAAQLIRFLQATPPGLSDTPLEPQFVELLRRCEEAKK